MIKLNELRTGNLLNYDNSEGETLPTKIDWQDLKWLDEDPKGFNLAHTPIPLTEEKLKELSFENWGEKFCNEYEKYDRWVLHNVVGGTSNFEVHIIHSNYGGVYHKEICFSIDNDERQFIHNTEFVHNLQNAYYLCVGHELYHTQAGGV